MSLSDDLAIVVEAARRGRARRAGTACIQLPPLTIADAALLHRALVQCDVPGRPEVLIDRLLIACREQGFTGQDLAEAT